MSHELDVFWKKSVGSVMDVIQILGFPMAYGISVCVTFIMNHALVVMLPMTFCNFGILQSKAVPCLFQGHGGWYWPCFSWALSRAEG